MKYRKKPVVIEAVLWTGNPDRYDNLCAVLGADPKKFHFGASIGDGDCFELVIPTLEGDHTAEPGDMIIRGVAGEFYPCKPDIFEQTYERVA